MAISEKTPGTATGNSVQAVTLPTHAAGDLLLIWFGQDNAPIPTTPTGWTFRSQRDANDEDLVLWYRVADGTETSVSLGNGTILWGAVIGVFAGVDGTDPFAVTTDGTNAVASTTNTLTIPGITTLADGALLVSGIIVDDNAVDKEPAITSGAVTRVEIVPASGRQRTVAMATGTQATAGASGAVTWSWTTNDPAAAILTALRPGEAPPPPTGHGATMRQRRMQSASRAALGRR